MRKLLYKSGTAIGLALLSPAALAATRDEVQTLLFGQVQIYVFIAFVIIAAIAVYFKKLPEDKHQTPLNRIFGEGKAIHSVGPDTPVSECVRLMTASKIGALIVYCPHHVDVGGAQTRRRSWSANRPSSI